MTLGRCGDGPCADPSCTCHAAFWDAAALAALRTPMPIDLTMPEAVRGRYRVASEASDVADALVAHRAGRVARATARALELQAQKDHPTGPWND